MHQHSFVRKMLLLNRLFFENRILFNCFVAHGAEAKTECVATLLLNDLWLVTQLPLHAFNLTH
jgi:hypothetical protein